MSPSPAAEAHALARRQLADAASLAARHYWLQVDRSNIAASWLGMLGQALAVVSGGQLAAARSTNLWLDDLLGTDPHRPMADRVNPAALVGITGDGRPLTAALMTPVWSALRLVTRGLPVVQAMAHGQAVMDLIVRTAIADAGRAADSVGMVARPAVTSYVRVVEGDACSRCIVLAGREYGVSKGFLRHPRCHCGMEPVTKDYRPEPTSPESVVASMTDGEKKKTFGEAGAKALDAGADVAQVVNARRGMTSAVAFGKRLQATTEGTTKRGIAGRRAGDFQKQAGRRTSVSRVPRLLPEEIFRQADDRAHAIRLLRQNAYIV